jgi:hypothetical protein
MRLLPQRGVFPNSTLNGVDPSQVGSKVFWFKPNPIYVTLSTGVSQWADAFGLGHNILQATGGAQPLYLPFTGPVSGGNGNYIYFPGNYNGEYVSTPDSAALSITGDIDIRCLCEHSDWQASTLRTFVSKYSTSSGQRSFLLDINSGQLNFSWSENGTLLRVANSTVVVPFTGQSLGAVRVSLDVDNGTGVYEVTFYTSPDGSSWTQLGSSVLGIAPTSIFDSTTKVEVGSRGDGTISCFNGKIYNLNIRDTISGGSPVASFNPDKGNAYSNTWIASSGETWTITNISAGAYHVQLVDQAMVVFDGTDDVLKSAPFTFNQPATIYLMCKQNSWTYTDYLIDGNSTAKMGLTQAATTPHIRQNAGTNGTENAGFALNTFRIITLIYNGATSVLKIDSTGTSVTSNAGSNNPGGINLGSRGDNTRWGNITVLEYLGYNSVHSSALQLSIITDMARRHKYTLT